MRGPATQVLWGQVLVVLATALLGMWAATQWTAHALAYQGQLGRPWFSLPYLGPVYFPLIFFWWWFSFDAYAPHIFVVGATIACGGAMAAVVLAIGMAIWRAREAKQAFTFGSARWADQRDVTAAGLFSADGVVLGQWKGRYLRHDGPEHILCFAPTRSGKGVGLVIPTLLTWPGGAIVHDIKGENFALTSGWRSKFSRVLLFDPTNTASAAYNPLLEVRRGEREVRDVQNIADILVDPDGSLERRSHWDKTAHTLLVGAILHVLYAEPDKSLSGVARFLSDPGRKITTTLNAMLKTPHLGKAGPHPVVAGAARELLNKSDNERSGVLSTAMSLLGLYRDPVIAEVTRRCDWRIADLVEGSRPATLYLVVPPSDIARTRPLIRLMLNQIGRRLTEELQSPARRHRLLLMLDEFAALGRLEFFETSLAFLAGYRVKAMLIAQSLNQIDKAYGPNHAILDNCHVRVAFSTNDERTAKRVSDALGTATELRAMKNYAGHRLSPWLGHLMVSRQETARALLTPGEVMQLPPDEELILLSGAPPVRASKVRYFEDVELTRRVGFKPNQPSSTQPPPTPDIEHGWSNRIVASPDLTGTRASSAANDADGGLRREPELPEHVEVTPRRSDEFDDYSRELGDEPDQDVTDVAFARRAEALARQASQDPADQLGL